MVYLCQRVITLAGMALNKIRTYFHGTFVFLVFGKSLDNDMLFSVVVFPQYCTS